MPCRLLFAPAHRPGTRVPVRANRTGEFRLGGEPDTDVLSSHDPGAGAKAAAGCGGEPTAGTPANCASGRFGRLPCIGANGDDANPPLLETSFRGMTILSQATLPATELSCRGKMILSQATLPAGNRDERPQAGRPENRFSIFGCSLVLFLWANLDHGHNQGQQSNCHK